jgi:hypothetical protein
MPGIAGQDDDAAGGIRLHLVALEPLAEAVTGRLGVRLLEFCRTRAFWLETVPR